MAAPLKRVTQRRRDRSELLECGHEHPGAYRKARRRRCSVCAAEGFDDAMAEIANFRTRHGFPPRIMPRPIEPQIAEEAKSAPVASDELNEPEPLETSIALIEAPSGPRCSYCLDHLGELQSCSGCRTLLHAECRSELRRCPTIGCSNPVSLVVATPRQIIIRPPHRPLHRRMWAAMTAVWVWMLNFLLRRRQ